ncbi:hypothetical protein CEE36_05770 [candidate division TA06 bacterium B3_TA06]|uniref:Periplasmic copper-binding protein NosD beta helix domain-containing protein n=1 Tax=candidate division TA06 bacterium B3_TA06 TaxID=2012487 RepID=A0A532V772_UNCT6|nr:MAG: hypothetical protein CEE36_05770 [candidate division TA06 bacterium B3_TA06]
MERKVMLPWSRLSVMTVVFAALVLTVGSAGATVIRVPADYPKVQQAIDAASSGDTVMVAGGRYAPSTNGESFPIRMKNGVRLIGAGAAVCTLDAERTNRVIYCSGISDTFTRVEGFTITNGNIRGNGGGIVCAGSSALTIANNVVTGNSAYWDGGGIDCDHSSFQIITNNVVTGNSAIFGGGIGCVYGSSPIITNNTVTGNSSTYGGGIGCWYSSNATITNNTVTGNSARYYGGGIYCHTSSPTITYNDVWGNAPQNYYRCGPGTGCISADPLFVDPTAGDYHLQPGSPCIDTGDNNAHGLQGVDFDGNPRIIAVVDMGAFEYQVPVIEATIDFDPDKLNFASKGKWVTCYIELPPDYSVEDINTSTVAITRIDGEKLDPLLYREGPTEIGDYDEDGIADLMVKFDREKLIDILKSMGYGDGDVVELTVGGKLLNGKLFAGSDTVEIIDKGKDGG